MFEMIIIYSVLFVLVSLIGIILYFGYKDNKPNPSDVYITDKVQKLKNSEKNFSEKKCSPCDEKRKQVRKEIEDKDEYFMQRLKDTTYVAPGKTVQQMIDEQEKLLEENKKANKKAAKKKSEKPKHKTTTSQPVNTRSSSDSGYVDRISDTRDDVLRDMLIIGTIINSNHEPDRYESPSESESYRRNDSDNSSNWDSGSSSDYGSSSDSSNYDNNNY